MSAPPAKPTSPAAPAPPAREAWIGLRVRLWLACISGGAVAGLGSLWVLGTRVRPGITEPGELLAWLAGVAVASVLVGILLALWIDHHVIGHLRGLLRGLNSGRVSELRGLPGGAGWGELSELGEAVQGMLARTRAHARSGDELEIARRQIEALRAAIEHWQRTEEWVAPAVGSGALADLSETLGRGLSRRGVVDEQNTQAARQVAGELAAAVADAQESAEQAERGFVEATALLTTVRELQRLSGELQGALGEAHAAPAPAAPDATPAREALEALVAASGESVDAIGRGMLRVQDVASVVQQLANRATLVAIHAVTAARRDESGESDDLTHELKELAHDVREATESAAQFALEIENAVAEASARMQMARAQAAERLEAAPAPPAPAEALRLGDAQRLLERVREMVQDAARKGERLSAAGERASRAAERLARRVGEEAAEAHALVVRLEPVGGAPAEPSAATSASLRLLEGETPAGEHSVVPGAGRSSEERP
ncbi:MAG TPA: hypothetical protein VMH61_07610 [Candidatus Acidoferrales bacterium]|nr:hypothetical protein [Candidatus Acidoferrales bacterium]